MPLSKTRPKPDGIVAYAKEMSLQEFHDQYPSLDTMYWISANTTSEGRAAHRAYTMAQFADVDGCRRVLRTTSRQRISRALEHYIYTSQALRNHSTISLRGLTSEEACEAIKAMREDRELQQLKQDFKEATAALEATEHETERTLKDVEEYEKGLKVQMKALENVMRKLHEMK